VIDFKQPNMTRGEKKTYVYLGHRLDEGRGKLEQSLDVPDGHVNDLRNAEDYPRLDDDPNNVHVLLVPATRKYTVSHFGVEVDTPSDKRSEQDVKAQRQNEGGVAKFPHAS
jgi:hypothetical protein